MKLGSFISWLLLHSFHNFRFTSLRVTPCYFGNISVVSSGRCRCRMWDWTVCFVMQPCCCSLTMPLIYYADISLPFLLAKVLNTLSTAAKMRNARAAMDVPPPTPEAQNDNITINQRQTTDFNLSHAALSANVMVAQVNQATGMPDFKDVPVPMICPVCRDSTVSQVAWGEQRCNIGLCFCNRGKKTGALVRTWPEESNLDSRSRVYGCLFYACCFCRFFVCRLLRSFVRLTRCAFSLQPVIVLADFKPLAGFGQALETAAVVAVAH